MKKVAARDAEAKQRHASIQKYAGDERRLLRRLALAPIGAKVEPESGAYRPESGESRRGFRGAPLPGGLVVVMSTSNGSSAPTAGTEAREG